MLRGHFPFPGHQSADSSAPAGSCAPASFERPKSPAPQARQQNKEISRALAQSAGRHPSWRPLPLEHKSFTRRIARWIPHFAAQECLFLQTANPAHLLGGEQHVRRRPGRLRGKRACFAPRGLAGPAALRSLQQDPDRMEISRRSTGLERKSRFPLAFTEQGGPPRPQGVLLIDRFVRNAGIPCHPGGSQNIEMPS
jgi:hypothetical protein